MVRPSSLLIVASGNHAGAVVFTVSVGVLVLIAIHFRAFPWARRGSNQSSGCNGDGAAIMAHLRSNDREAVWVAPAASPDHSTTGDLTGEGAEPCHFHARSDEPESSLAWLS